MTADLVPGDSAERRIEKLERINAALMRRVERLSAASGEDDAYGLFERAATLEAEVRARTADLHRAIDLLNESNAALEGARADLAGAVEAIEEGFALFDAAGRLVRWNARFAEAMPDLRAGLVAGLTFDAYVDLAAGSEHLALPAGTSRAAWAAERRARHAEGQAAFNVPIRGGRWLQVSERRTPSGGTVVLQTDVTGILRAERVERDRMLDDQARVIRATLDHIPQGVVVLGAGGRIVGFNRRVGHLLSLPVAALRLGAGFGAILEGLAERAAFDPDGAGPGDLRAYLARPDPEPFVAELSLGGRRLALTAQGMSAGVLVTLADVTVEREAMRVVREANERLERRVRDRTLELEDALAEAERAQSTRSRFVAAASHDLLQPLSAAKLYLSSLDFERADPRAEAAAKAGRALESVEAILDALLQISRLDSGRLDLEPGEVALGPLLGRLREEFAPAAQARGLALRVVPTRAVVRSDPMLLRRVLQNLVANAVRYTEAGGVLLGARRRGEGVAVQVLDTGPGIAEADLDAAFQEFRRLAGTVGEGMGLGLAIVERACGALGHPLEVESRPGRGTRFSVLLPPAEAPPEAPLVMVVEACPHARGARVAAIEALGLDAVEAEDPDAAVALLEQIEVAPDALIGSDAGVLSRVRARLGPLPAGVPGLAGAAGGVVPLPERPARADVEALIARR